MRLAAAAVGALAGAVAFAPVFCVTQHDDPGGSSTRCQALVHWLPPLRDQHAPGGAGGLLWLAAGTAATALLLWLLAAPFDKRKRDGA